MTASWLTADLAADSSLLRALDADGGSSMGLLPAPSLLGGVFGLENSWTMGLPRTSAGDPPAERGPVSFRGIAARLGVGEQHRQESALQVQSITGGEQAAGATQSEPARWAPGSLAPLPWVPQLPTSAAGPLPITMAHPHSSSGQLHAAAPVTVSAARQAILARLQHVLSNPPPPRHGGGETGSNRDPPQAPLLPATLLSEAVAYPSLVTAAVQRSQAPQQQQQPQQTGALPPSSAVRERTSPAVSATAASQHQGSQQTISKQPETAGVAIIGRPRPPAQPAARAAPSTDLPAAVRSACAACDGAAQHAASADRSMMPTYRLTVPSAERRAQPEPPVAAAAWQAPPHPVTLPSAPQDAGAASGEETEDEAPPPPVKRMRRTTAAAAAAAAAAHREDYVKASEFKGVKLNRSQGRWEAQIKAAGKLVYLGIYDEEGEAAEAYDQALIAVRGRDAETNFPHEHYSERWAELTGGITLAALAAELRAEHRARQAAEFYPRDSCKHEQSRYKGVLRQGKSGRWRAQINVGARTIWLGLWPTEDAAAACYDRAAICKRGVHKAATNFPIDNYAEEFAALGAQAFEECCNDLRAQSETGRPHPPQGRDRDARPAIM